MRDAFLINRARELSCGMGEQTIAELVGGTKRPLSKGADLRLDDETNVEVKCRLYGQPINILIKQLLEMDDNDIYALAYYKTLCRMRPYSILKRKGPEDEDYAYFLNSVFFSKIFLFPALYIKHFYDTTHMKEVTISSSGLRHKGLSVRTATRIYDNAEEQKAIFRTPMVTPKNPDTITYAVGERVVRILEMKGFEMNRVE